MATGTTYDDSEFLFRLQTLIIDGGTEVLRNTFDQKLQNTPLHVFLANEYTPIKGLRAQKTITAKQYGLLYPSGRQHPNSAEFDITLIICLLRNLPSLGLRQNYPWNTQPQSTDESIESDLYRLKVYRNQIAHISSTEEFDKATFHKCWRDIEHVLERLNDALPNPDPHLKQKFEEYENRALDPAAERRLRLVLEQWTEMERGLDTEMQIIKTDLKQVQHNVSGGFQRVVEQLSEQKELITASFEKVHEELSVHRSEKKPKKGSHSFQRIFSSSSSSRYKELKNDLIEFYRRHHAKMLLSPLIEEETPLLDFYVMPDINSVKTRFALGGGGEFTAPVHTLSNIFCTGSTFYNDIYLTADAGYGKTLFSKRLTLAWCQSAKPIKADTEHFSKEELDALSGFSFVFLLLLRDSCNSCDIDDMILNQIVSRLGHSNYTLTEIENILSKKRCLVILDGLDEWTHPFNNCKQGWSSIPHRKARACTILTTTRPWKLKEGDVKSSDIDQKLEIAGLSEKSANALKKSIIACMCNVKDAHSLKRCIDEFSEETKDKDVSSLERNPLLLVYMLCMWCDKIKLTESQSRLYSNIIELLFSRTVKKIKEIPSVTKYTHVHIPQCFTALKYCGDFYTLLTTLAQLAFEMLLNESRENTLVFDSSHAEACLKEKLFKFCLQSGILTQNKITGRLTQKEAKVSFAHKTVQEFFVALYMHSNADKEEVVNRVISQCSSIKDILELSKVVIFLSGINVNVSSLLFRELINVINDDETTQNYRTMTNVFGHLAPFLKELQSMCISCLDENPDDTGLRIILQDLFIDEDCRQGKYYKQLKKLAVQSKENIKSVSIEMEGIPHREQDIISDFKLADLNNVEKIYYCGTFNNFDCTPILHRSVKCLSLVSCKWENNNLVPERSNWSSALASRFCNLDNLEAVHIDCFKISHDLLKRLVEFLSAKKSMREVMLGNVFCDGHGHSCPGSELNLSQHESLRVLELSNIPLSDIKINVSSLEASRVGRLPTPMLMSSYFWYLRAAGKLHTFVCNDLTFAEDIDAMLDTLPVLGHVRMLVLYDINLGDRNLSVSKMVNIEHVALSCVTMTVSTFGGFVASVKKLPQKVTVDTRDCNVTPEKKFKREKEKLKASKGFIVTFDGIDQYKKKVFEFTTIKDI